MRMYNYPGFCLQDVLEVSTAKSGCVLHLTNVYHPSSDPKSVYHLNLNPSHVLHGTPLPIPSAALNCAPDSAEYAPGSSRSCPRFSRSCPRVSRSRPRFSRLCPRVSRLRPRFSRLCPRFSKLCPRLSKLCPRFSRYLLIIPRIGPAGAALTSVFSHVLASLSTEARASYPSPRDNIKIKVPGVESLFSRIGAVYTFAGPLAGDRDFAAFTVDMYGNGSKRKMFRINHSSDIVPKVVCSAMLTQEQNP